MVFTFSFRSMSFKILIKFSWMDSMDFGVRAVTIKVHGQQNAGKTLSKYVCIIKVRVTF